MHIPGKMSSTRKRDQTTASTSKSVGKKTSVNAKKSPVKRQRKRHNCSFCVKDFDKKDRLLGHIQKHHSEEQQLYCPLCNISFKTEIQYQVHLKEHSKSPFQHKVYQKKFNSQSLLDIHSNVQCKTPIKKSRIECKECGSLFIKQKTLITHMLKYHNLLQCPDCEEYFTQTAGLRAHNNACHSLKRMSGDVKVKAKVNEKCHSNQICKFCWQVFASDSELVPHMTLFHKGLKCAKCDVWCKGKMSLINHVKNCKKKPKVNLFICHICKKQFAKVDTLVSHIKSCISKVKKLKKAELLPKKGSQPPKSPLFQCSVCGKEFPSQVSFKRHHDTCPRKFNCSICSKTFSSEKALSSHVQIFHTGAKLFKCKVCNKRFPHLNILQVHTAMFHNPQNADIVPGLKSLKKKKTHKCRVCRKAFFQYSFLKMHMKNHSAEKRLVCGICGEKFSNETAVIDHINIFHLTGRDRGNIENQEFVIECINANGERWNEAVSTPNPSDEGQGSTDKEANTQRTRVDQSVLITAVSEQRPEQISLNKDLLSHSSMSSKETYHKQHCDVNILNTTGAKTAGEICCALETLVERQHIKKEADYEHNQDALSTADNMHMSNDQVNMYTDYLNHLPQQKYTDRPQGDSLLVSAPMQYSNNSPQRSEDHHEVQANTDTVVSTESCIQQESSLHKDAERNISDSQHLTFNCDDEEFYIVLNHDADEEDENLVNKPSIIEDNTTGSNLQHDSFEVATSSVDCIKQEDSGTEMDIVETGICHGTEDSVTSSSNIEQRASIHVSEEACESKENLKQFDQMKTSTCSRTQNSDSEVVFEHCGNRSGNFQKCISERSRVYMCGICQQGFRGVEDLNQHKMASHSLRCTQCGQQYMRMIDLVTHYESCIL